MKKSLLIIFLIPLIFSCKNYSDEAAKKSIKKEVLDVAVKYARQKFTSSKVTVDAGGVVTVQDSVKNLILSGVYQIRYVIDPAKIRYGLINDDSTMDAIVHISDINNQDLDVPEHLILLQSDGKFILSRVIESNMNVLGIKDRIITAEVSTKSLNSPLRDCHVCKEVVNFRFKSGDLIRVEK